MSDNERVISYAYDDLGRLLAVNYFKEQTHNYEYDYRGYLIRDNNLRIEYDNNGNILKKGNVTYTYDSVIKDRLIKVGNETIEYDANNPLIPTKYLDKRLKFEGKRLKEVTKNNKTSYFYYDEEGYLIKKIDGNGKVTSFIYENGNLLYLKKDNDEFDFLYDENNVLYGFILNKCDTYYYIRDIFNNILGILDCQGEIIVSYEYDAFGKNINTKDSSSIQLGILNPFKYKGYYYDDETGWFWLSSRYYSSELCRFINPDSVDYLKWESINGLNLYAYAKNNPIMYYDPSGHSAILAIGLLAGSFIVGAGTSVVSQGLAYGWDEINCWQAGVDGLFALGSTAFAMTGIGTLASVGIGAFAGWSQYAIDSAFHEEDLTLLGSLTAFGLGAIGGAISGAGARNSANIASSMKLTGKGASAVKAITTASNRYLAGEISIKGLQATTRLWGNVALNAVQDAISPTIRILMIKGTIAITGWTVATVAINYGLSYLY